MVKVVVGRNICGYSRDVTQGGRPPQQWQWVKGDIVTAPLSSSPTIVILTISILAILTITPL